MIKGIVICLLPALVLLCTGCGSAPAQKDAGPVPAEEAAQSPSRTPPPTEKTENMEKALHLVISGTEVSVAWEDNESVRALMELAASEPLTVQMSMYGGFEQVGSLGATLPRDDSQTTTQAGDIVLYSGSQIVIFYGSNSWAYTRLGKITDKSAAELTELLGSGDVTVTLSRE